MPNFSKRTKGKHFAFDFGWHPLTLAIALPILRAALFAPSAQSNPPPHRQPASRLQNSSINSPKIVWDGVQTYVPEVIEISGGQVHIVANKTTHVPIGYTFGTFAQIYGRFEIRFRIHAGGGLKPVFRFLPFPRANSRPSTVSSASAPTKACRANPCPGKNSRLCLTLAIVTKIRTRPTPQPAFPPSSLSTTSASSPDPEYKPEVPRA